MQRNKSNDQWPAVGAESKGLKRIAAFRQPPPSAVSLNLLLLANPLPLAASRYLL
jgi:hypothetical protein